MFLVESHGSRVVHGRLKQYPDATHFPETGFRGRKKPRSHAASPGMLQDVDRDDVTAGPARLGDDETDRTLGVRATSPIRQAFGNERE